MQKSDEQLKERINNLGVWKIETGGPVERKNTVYVAASIGAAASLYNLARLPCHFILGQVL